MRVNGCMAFVITLLGDTAMIAFVIVDALMDLFNGKTNNNTTHKE